MNRPRSLDLGSRLRVRPEDLASSGLRYAAANAQRPVTVERVAVRSGGRAELLELVYFPVTGRAGVGWRDGVWWLDAPSPELAMERWILGSGRSGRRRNRRAAASAAPTMASAIAV